MSETVKVVWAKFNRPVIINKADFDPAIHSIYDEAAASQPPPVVESAPVQPDAEPRKRRGGR